MRRVVLPAIAVLLCLSGCATPAPSETASSLLPETPTADMRASSTWEGYFSTYLELSGDLEKDVSALKPYASKSEYDAAVKQVQALRKQGVVLTQGVTARNFRVETEAHVYPVVAFVCVENGASRFRDSDGEDVTPRDRAKQFTLRLQFIEQSGRLVLDKDEAWKQTSAC